MASQAAFVPEYLEANFNTMPLLPLALGLLSRLGMSDLIGPVLVTRIFSLLGLVLLVGVYWKLLQKNIGAGFVAAFAAAMGLLWDPVIRWGTQVVRTETWVAIAWIMILRELVTLQRPEIAKQPSRSLWRIGGWLAFGAYTHFEAIVWAPAVVVALWPFTQSKASFKTRARIWLFRNLEVAWKTLVFLSPWLLYVIWNFSLFLSQMHTQFFRLDQENSYFRDSYSIFHNLFLSLGNAGGWPKFFNLAKAVFWLGLLGLVAKTAVASKDRARLAPLLGSAVAFAATYWLWYKKPEVWFITLCHAAFWAWFAVAFPPVEDRRARKVWIAFASVLAFLSIATTAIQSREIPAQYNWTTYQAWVDCIDRTIRLGVKDSATRPALKVWQPHVPDVLIELRARRPAYELTRALDFPAAMDRAREYSRTVDALVLSRHAPVLEAAGRASVYEGAERPDDREILKNELEVPFGTWTLEAEWRHQICHHGPFWASIALH